MYLVIILAIMFVLPLTLIGINAFVLGAPLGAALFLQWFVFFAGGWRLFLAGIKQISQPGYTAKTILGVESEQSFILVRELGFANVSIGLMALASLAVPAWQTAAALAAGVFYALAGINHLLQPGRNHLQNTAMITDLAAAALLLTLGGLVMFAG